jgi:glycosyltransferase involved in cell wall biosynthesis
MGPGRVAYVVTTFPKLSQTFVSAELAELRRRGVEVRVLSLRRPDEERCHGYVADAGLLERTVYDPPSFVAVLREFRPDVLHAHFARHATAAARKLSAELGVPFTFTAHGYDIFRRPPAKFAEHAAAAGAVVVVSEAIARYIRDGLGARPDRIHVIPNGVDIERFQPDGQRPDLLCIVCVARLAPVKNLGLLLEACAELRTRGLEFRCAIVGDGPCRDELVAARARLGLDGMVDLVGAAEQAEVLAWWRRATVAALTSESEGLGVSLMEAAACGVPAVATAVGGVPEVVEDGVTGLLVPPGDARALAGALERVLRDPGLAARLGAAARRRAGAHFSLARQVDRLLALWAEMMRP